MKKSDMPLLSIIIPFYNERGSIDVLLKEYERFIKDYNFELICINNGSTDGSEKLLYDYSQKKQYNFMKIITVKKNKGYGHGIITGVKKANGEIIAWTHADMQTHPADVFRAYGVYKRQQESKIIVKGSRKGRKFMDVFVSLGMAAIATILLRTPLYEINAQPKLFHKSLLPYLTHAPDDFMLDLFLLYKAKRLNYKIRIIKVNFPKRPTGTSKWAYSFRSRLRMMKRTIQYIYELSGKKNWKDS